MTPPATVRARPLAARVAGGVWLAAAGALVLAGLVVLVDQHRIGWELLVGAATTPLGWWLWNRHLVVDAHGIEQCVGWRRTRLLWGVVESVEVDAAAPVTAPVRVHLVGRGTVVLTAGWGMSRAQRTELARTLDAVGPDVPTPA